MKRKAGQYTVESWILANGKAGDYFYSDKKDRNLTASAFYYKRKINTERVIVVSVGEENVGCKYITKVTLL